MVTETLKHCLGCKQDKPLTEFWKDRYRSSGYHSRCRDCTNNQRARKHRKYITKNLNEITDARELLKRKARIEVANAVKTGKLVRQDCMLCGDPKTYGHHLDYDYPLAVVWLCRKHHEGVHYEIRLRQPVN